MYPVSHIDSTGIIAKVGIVGNGGSIGNGEGTGGVNHNHVVFGSLITGLGIGPGKGSGGAANYTRNSKGGGVVGGLGKDVGGGFTIGGDNTIDLIVN